MQGPRLSSHYNRNVPDLALHLPEHASPLPPPVKLPSSSSELPSLSTSLHPATAPSNGTKHSQDSPTPSIASIETCRDAAEDERDEIERSKEPGRSPQDSDPVQSTLPIVGKARSSSSADGGEGGGGDDEKLNFQQRLWKVLKRHSAFVGPGVVASIAYLDPGNWSTDLQAGSAVSSYFRFLTLSLPALVTSSLPPNLLPPSFIFFNPYGLNSFSLSALQLLTQMLALRKNSMDTVISSSFC
jgi:hypothetical protein